MAISLATPFTALLVDHLKSLGFGINHFPNAIRFLRAKPRFGPSGRRIGTHQDAVENQVHHMLHVLLPDLFSQFGQA